MTGYTSRHALPYPVGGDKVAVHTDVKRLAEKTDLELSSIDLGDELADAEQRIQGSVDARLAPVESSVESLRSGITGLDQRVEAVEAIAGLEPGDVSDATVASIIAQDGTLTRDALDDLYAGAGYTVDASTYGVVADGSTDDSAAIQAALTAMPEGATLAFPPGRAVRLASPFTINRPARISGGRFLTSTGQAINVTSTDVHIDGVEIVGPGTSTPYKIRNHGIHVEGTTAARLRVKITNSTILGMRDSAIWLEHATDFIIDSCRIDGFRYAGIWVADGKRGRVTGNTVGGASSNPGTESYGIAMTSTDGTVENRTDSVIVAHNHVSGLVDHTGIDTHGGINITFAFNHVRECQVGIAGTVGNSDRKTAPERMVVIGNTIIGPASTSLTTTGIAVGGSPDTHPLGPLWADVMAMSNVIRGVNIAINLPGPRGEKVDRALSQIKHNSSSAVPIVEIPIDGGGAEVLIEYVGDGVYRIGE